VFWVISVYVNIRNTFPKSGTLLLGHSVYVEAFGRVMHLSYTQGPGILNKSLWKYVFFQCSPLSEIIFLFFEKSCLCVFEVIKLIMYVFHNYISVCPCI